MKDVEHIASRRGLIAASFLAVPFVVFYAILIRFVVNIPSYDDYNSILEYLDKFKSIPTAHGRFLYFVTTQHNEYKLFLIHTILWFQYAVSGHINLSLLCALGNLIVLGIGCLLWKMFLPRQTDQMKRLILFIPVSLLLFQLNFAEALDWAMPGLQCLGVVLFSLTSIYLLTKRSLLSFGGAVAALVLAVASLTNAFLVVPVGVLILMIQRRYGRLALWLGASAACIAVYAYRYNVMSSQTSAKLSVFQTLLHTHPIYVFVFIGNAFFFPRALGLLFGLLIAGYFAYIYKQGYYRQNPVVSYCLIFLLLTAIGVAGIRSDFGPGQATTSRYRIYGDLFLIFVWISMAEIWFQKQTSPLRRNPYFRAVLAGCLLYSALADAWGFQFLARRHHMLLEGMRLYEHPQVGKPAGPVLPVAGQTTALDGFDEEARRILDHSIQTKIYEPPAL